jgi:N6-L-threonylcarbamoyladenine synthase
MIVLGIETSCDETAAAVVENGRRTLSSIVASQVEVHNPYGGVVPELASRMHMEAVVPVVMEAVGKAGLVPGTIDAVAVTQGPGLIGALLVGFNFARAFSFSLGIPYIGVNHLEGHVNSLFLEPRPPSFPFVSLLSSGGHTGIYYVTSHTSMELMGQTRDDAAGEAFDKVAKMLGLGYPGGAVISKSAKDGDPRKIIFPRPYLDKSGFDFSFSGIKTSVMRYIQTHPETYEKDLHHITAGFQEAVVDVLIFKIKKAAEHRDCRNLCVVGGVAANELLRNRLQKEAGDLNVFLPSISFCGDNAAMIAVSGYHRLVMGQSSGPCEDVYSRAF